MCDAAKNSKRFNLLMDAYGDPTSCGEKLSMPTEQTFQYFFETASDLIAMIDKYGNLIHMNKSCAETLGYTKAELIGVHITHILGETSKQKHISRFHELIKMGKIDFESIWLTKNGNEIFGDQRVVAIYDSHGQFAGAMGVFRDITMRKLAEKALKKREAELNATNKALEEMNIALRVLLKRRDEDKKELEEKVLSNIKQLVEPYLEDLRMTELNKAQRIYIDILEQNLRGIISSFTLNLTSTYLNFSPTEIRVSNLIKQGRTTKEMAELMKVSEKAISFHRQNIRKKMNLIKKKINLKSYLQIQM
ncbi:putative Transcriptional regulator, LuxR family [uncultured Desulfobacterium sp.]|uniref:Putative Transcriptional regulator, LuxR family n=1 Tax=uncultured Desulfobacterium sp. TaxID=201089 RepID=A0A445N0P0_9BACT|nr:putative Transcriptional regulator, LuxR family [uncultured Desulfobacterium sp.]